MPSGPRQLSPRTVAVEVAAGEGDGPVRVLPAESPRGVRLRADRHDGRAGSLLVEVLRELRVARVLLQREHLLPAPVAGQPHPARDRGVVRQHTVDVAVSLVGPAHVLGQRSGGEHVVGHHGDRTQVTEIGVGGIGAVVHQRLDVAHLVLLDDLLRQCVDDDHHDLLGRVRLGRTRTPRRRRGADTSDGKRDRQQGEDDTRGTAHGDLPIRPDRRCAGPGSGESSTEGRPVEPSSSPCCRTNRVRFSANP